MDMNLPLFQHMRRASIEKSEEGDVVEMLGPLAHIIFHITQSADGCREDKMITGRESDDVNTNLAEYLSSFVLYSGDALDSSQINAWAKELPSEENTEVHEVCIAG